MLSATVEKVVPVLRRYKAVKLAYLFGSRARNDAGPMSDYDFAVYLDGLSKRAMFDYQLTLLSELQEALGTNEVDLVILNTTEGPELKYEIIKDGLRIHEVEPYRILIEPRIMSEYFDFCESLRRNGLTNAVP